MLRRSSRLQECTVAVDSFTLSTDEYVQAKPSSRAFIGVKRSVGIYHAVGKPEQALVLIPAKSFSIDPSEKVAVLPFTIATQTDVSAGVSGELPPLISFYEDTPLFFEGVDPTTGHGLFRFRFQCLGVSETKNSGNPGSIDGKCVVPELSSQEVSQFSFLLAQRSADSTGLLPDDAEAMFASGGARVKVISNPEAETRPFFEISGLLGPVQMIETEKLWLLARYVSPVNGAVSYAAWAIATEKL